MDESGLTDRQRWFRFFPEGSIEFVVITRVLLLCLLLAFGVVRDTQRPFASVALAGLLLTDYWLTLWWVIQLLTDCRGLFDGHPLNARALRRERRLIGAVGILPSVLIVAMALVGTGTLQATPLGAFLATPDQQGIGLRAAIMVIVIAILLLPALLFAYRILRRAGGEPPCWTFLLLIPVVHWLALHRLVLHLKDRLAQYGRSGEPSAPVGSHLNTMAAFADVLWVLSVLPWACLVVISFTRGVLPTGMAFTLVPVCGTGLAAVFAVLDVALMEHLQRHFVKMVRRLPRG